MNKRPKSTIVAINNFINPSLEPLSVHPYIKKWAIHWGEDAPFFASTTGTWGMYCRQTRHYWFGIPRIVNLRLSISWG